VLHNSLKYRQDVDVAIGIAVIQDTGTWCKRPMSVGKMTYLIFNYYCLLFSSFLTIVASSRINKSELQFIWYSKSLTEASKFWSMEEPTNLIGMSSNINTYSLHMLQWYFKCAMLTCKRELAVAYLHSSLQ
jgi:hypothetical protein